MTIHDLRTRHGDASDGSADQVGGRLSRVDGPAKVTGAAKYAVEQQLDGLAHAVLVESTAWASPSSCCSTAYFAAPVILAGPSTRDSRPPT